ncbi:GGDEF domain-containing protein [Aliiglaciecola sp. CAU 1673]|uniref:GGDEF domain-containing protein n=1 Tax=Aliiglaciecola sp. CAU 1673 TaxID=3032595 RepID=UPI0023DBD769|nr:GGDEF domain-containing protein [Aliiglaciecola sp. CAU 1673]MDF2177261.1 GGDEF domain-containing protein [Aliiglaciecola sp. CAU 1673]
MPFAVYAKTLALNEFLRDIQSTPRYCLSQEQFAELDQHLADRRLTPPQAFHLKLRKVQYLTCSGKHEEARELLMPLLEERDEANDGDYAYAMFLAGYTTSWKDLKTRCDWFAKAADLAKTSGVDPILLDVKLEYIAGCDLDTAGIEKNLSQMYALLERYSGPEHQLVRSDIFNSLGMLHVELGQNELAGDQFYKAYELSEETYTGETLMTALANASHAYLRSGNLDKVKPLVEKMIQLNIATQSPLSNALLHQLLATQAEQSGDFQALEESLLKWAVFLPELSIVDMEQHYRRLQASLCLHQQDLLCVRDYLELEVPQRPLAESDDLPYLRLVTEAYFALGENKAAEQAFTYFADTSEKTLRKQQSAAKILGVAQLRADIVNLESNLERAEQERALAMAQMIAAIVFGVVVLVAMGWFLYNRHARYYRQDELTGLLNSKATLDKLKTLERPSPLRVHALARFELDELDDINAEYGHSAGDKALKHIAMNMQRATRHGDVVGRMGINEFLVCLNDIDEVRARTHIERLSLAIADSGFSVAGGQSMKLQPAYSIMILDDAPSDVRSLYQGLCQAMAQGKKQRQAQHSVG